jgi:hypothetical protein
LSALQYWEKGIEIHCQVGIGKQRSSPGAFGNGYKSKNEGCDMMEDFFKSMVELSIPRATNKGCSHGAAARY